MKVNKPIYLASTSPRRKEILDDLQLDFHLIDSDYEENNESDMEPAELAKAHAIGKARAALKNLHNVSEGIVLGSDTIVVLQNQVLGKPKDRDDGFRMLKQLSGNQQTVISAIALIDVASGKELVSCDHSLVTFITLTEQMIENYLARGEYSDKAGAYAVQGHARVFVKSIEGSYTNIIGLPSHLLLEMLEQLES